MTYFCGINHYSFAQFKKKLYLCMQNLTNYVF